MCGPFERLKRLPEILTKAWLRQVCESGHPLNSEPPPLSRAGSPGHQTPRWRQLTAQAARCPLKKTSTGMQERQQQQD